MRVLVCGGRGHLYMAHIRYHTNYGVWRCTVRDKTSAALRGDFTTPEAAKAAVEEALRGLSAKTGGKDADVR